MVQIIRHAAILAVTSAVFFLMALSGTPFTGFIVYSQGGGNATLVAWDDTDDYGGPVTKYTYPTSLYAHGMECYSSKDPGDYDVHFFANYTSSAGVPIDGATGSCSIRFDENNDTSYESWVAMSYNATSYLWNYNRSFTYKGLLNFQVNCSSASYDDFTLTDNVTVQNTGPPCIFDTDPGGYIPSATCDEETSCTYLFGNNVSDDDANDVLAYTVTSGSFSGFSINPSTGTWTVLVENLTAVQYHTINLQVNDSEGSTNSILQNITVEPINDPPAFSLLPSNATEDEIFSLATHPESVITATDEEDNTPFRFNATFVSCEKAHWIANRTSNCSLFGFTATNANLTIHSFTPTNWNVGTYVINFTVGDSGSSDPQFGYNATNSTLVNFTVYNVNDAPSIVSLNGTSVSISQGGMLYIVFNGTDIENDTLSFNATTLLQNMSNATNSSLFYMTTNSSGYPNSSARGIIYVTLLNGHVGNFTLNVTVTDNGTNTENMSASILFNLTILNVNDPPELIGVDAILPYAVEEKDYTYYFNASDPDLLTPYGDNLTFSMSFVQCLTPAGSECSIEENSTFGISKDGSSRGLLHIFAVRNDTGNYTLNVSVADASGLLNWTLVNISIQEDDPPVITAASYFNTTQNQTFFYTFNASDPQNDTLVIAVRTLYRNMTLHSYGLFNVSVDSSGYPPLYNLTMNYTPVSNSQVGNYTVEINATDIWNLSTVHFINMTTLNINDPPAITIFTSCGMAENYTINLSLYENAQYCIMPYIADVDTLVPTDFYDENLTYSMAYIQCTAQEDYYPSGNCSGNNSISMNTTTGYVQFTAENESWHGNYTYNLTITDALGEYASMIMGLTIYPVNDPPVLTGLPLELNITTEYPFSYQVNATDEENNTPFFYNVSFTLWELPAELFTVGWYTGLIDYTPDPSEVGNYTANFTVMDAGNATFGYPNATGSYTVNVTVTRSYHVPSIQYLYPESTYSMTEGAVKRFFYEANDSLDNDTLTCTWYINGTQIAADNSLAEDAINPVDNCNTTIGSGIWRYPVTYDDALNLSSFNVTIMLIVEDPQGYTANESVNMTVLAANRAPRLNQTIASPITWYNDMTITPIDLSDNFVEDYGEEMSYTYTGGANIQVSMNGSSVTLTSGSWYGTSWIVFIANDTEYNASSNNVTLIVEYQPPEEVPVTRYTYMPKVASMAIVVDDLVKARPGNTSMANVTIVNDGDYDLRNVRLNVSINETSNITVTLRDTFISELLIGQNMTTVAYISIGDISMARTYYAVVRADSASPAIFETATITIKAEPTNESKLTTEIRMIKDMFAENPECMELFGLIEQAEEKLYENDLEEAKRLTGLAIQNCQDMLNYAKLPKNETAAPGKPSIVGQIFVNPFFVMGFIIAILSMGMVAYWVMSRRQQVLAAPKTIKKD